MAKNNLQKKKKKKKKEKIKNKERRRKKKETYISITRLYSCKDSSVGIKLDTWVIVKFRENSFIEV